MENKSRKKVEKLNVYKSNDFIKNVQKNGELLTQNELDKRTKLLETNQSNCNKIVFDIVKKCLNNHQATLNMIQDLKLV